MSMGKWFKSPALACVSHRFCPKSAEKAVLEKKAVLAETIYSPCLGSICGEIQAESIFRLAPLMGGLGRFL